MKRFFLLFLLLIPSIAWASECSSPNEDWYFYSCFDAGNLTDGSKWDADHCEECSVVTDAPAGGPDSTYALKVVWPTSYAGDCSNGDDYRLEYYQNSPNPFYERFYVYSTNYRAAYASEGGEYCGGYKFGRMSGSTGSATGLYIESKDDDPDGPFYVEIKNHAPENDGDPNFEEYWYNYRSGEKLNGYGDWPGKERNSELTPNAWHCIELGVYRHDTEGWIKLWVDGELAVNASGSAFSAATGYAVNSGGSGTYNTKDDGGSVEAYLQIPGFRNGGGNPAHTEYFKNIILSSSPIGLAGEEPPADTTAPTLSSASPSGAQPCTSDPRNVTISVDCSDATGCTACKADTANVDIDSMSITLTQSGSTWSGTASNLSCDDSYTYYAKCEDAADNESDATTISFSISAAEEPPVAPKTVTGLRIVGGTIK